MAFFDQLGKKISSTSQNMMQKAKGLVDITGLKSQISDEEKKINKYYYNLGKMYYASQKESPLPEFEELVGMLNGSFAKIDELNEMITTIENVKICPNCGTPIEDDMIFCTGCGAKIEHGVPKEAAQEEAPARFCTNCGAPLQSDAIFCMNCGAKQE